MGTLPYAGRFEEAALRSSDEAESTREAQLFENGGFSKAFRFIFKHFEAGGWALLQGRCLKEALRRPRRLHWGRCLKEGVFRRL